MGLQFLRIWLLLNENLGVCGKILSSHNHCDLGFVLWIHRWKKKMGGVVFNGGGVRAGEACDILPQKWEREMWWGRDCHEPPWFTRSHRKKNVKKTQKCSLWVRGFFLALLFFPLPLGKNGAADIFHVHLSFLDSLIGVCGIDLWPLTLNDLYLLNRTWATSGNNNMAVMPYYYEKAG